MRGFGSNCCCAGPDLRFAGTAPSARFSIKSRTIKSLLEKSSNVKLGPRGKSVFALDEARSIALVRYREATFEFASREGSGRYEEIGRRWSRCGTLLRRIRR